MSEWRLGDSVWWWVDCSGCQCRLWTAWLFSFWYAKKIVLFIMFMITACLIYFHRFYCLFQCTLWAKQCYHHSSRWCCLHCVWIQTNWLPLWQPYCWLYSLPRCWGAVCAPYVADLQILKIVHTVPLLIHQSSLFCRVYSWQHQTNEWLHYYEW